MEQYEPLEMEIIIFDSEDVITESTTNHGDWPKTEVNNSYRRM